MTLLECINGPEDLKGLSQDQLTRLAGEIRDLLIATTVRTSGHLGPNLGVVELTVALHHVFDTPNDRLVWDVGHQCYPHKILTGRRDRITTIKKKNGLAPFPKREESEYDTFGVGHSSTSIRRRFRATSESILSRLCTSSTRSRPGCAPRARS